MIHGCAQSAALKIIVRGYIARVVDFIHIRGYGVMFFLWVFDLALINARINGFRGFNTITVAILDSYEVTQGYFTVIKKN
uniref:Uncharacterized protein n=1 Tax=viral metagenome TaxID=1070528 RepID=A0A6M3J088_9ZZZZ